MLFKNQSGAEMNVSNVSMKDGRIFFSVRGKGCGQRFLNRNICVVMDEEAEDGTFLKCADGWKVVTGKERQPRQPKAQDEQPTEVVPQEQPQTQHDDTTNEQALIAAIKNLRGGAVDIAKVREIVSEELSKLLATDAKKAAKVIEAVKKSNGKKDEVYCAKFQRIVAKVSRGNNVYLYGPAGSGKSHTAEQVADALGLDFYGQTTIQFAHDVRGYGDAGGSFQETPFFKAFAYGGLYFQDEYDRSNAEAAIRGECNTKEDYIKLINSL